MIKTSPSFSVYEDENGLGPVLVPTSAVGAEIQSLLQRFGARALRLSESK